jgi:hypothetical protein
VWQIATWVEHEGQTGVERCYTRDGILHLLLVNDPDEGYLSSAVQTRKEYYFGRWEFRGKPSAVPGVLNAFYTIDWNNTAAGGSGSGTHQEIDIEFLSKSFGDGDGEVHYAVHATDRESWGTVPDIGLGFDPSEDFHVYGFEIAPEYIEWFVDERVLQRYTYSSRPVTITAPYQLKLNHWTRPHWVGGPPTPGDTCDFQIDWVRFTPRGSSGVRVSDSDGPGSTVSPAPRQGVVTFSLAAGSPVILTLFDASGRPARRIHRAFSPAGTHSIHVEEEGLVSGVYVLVPRTGGDVTTRGHVLLE